MRARTSPSTATDKSAATYVHKELRMTNTTRWALGARGTLGRLAVLGAAGALLLTACGGNSDHVDKTSAQASGSSSPAPTGSLIKLGWIGTTSGPAAPPGQAAQAAVKAWEKSVNAHGGVHGHPVKVIYQDDAGDPARGQAAVKSLVENDKVIALVGIHGNTTEPTWEAYVAQHKVPVVGGESDTTVWLSNPYFFVSGEPGVATLDTEAYVTKNVGKKVFGSINEGNVQDVGPLIKLLQGSTAKYGLTYPFHTTATSAEPNYTAKCLAARNADVEVLALNLAPNTRQRVVADCSRQNLKVNYLIPSGAFTPDALKQS